MRKQLPIIIGLIGIIAIAAILFMFFRAPEEASGPIESVPLAVATEVPATVAAEPTNTPQPEPTDAPAAEPTAVPEEEPTEEPMQEPTAEPVVEPTAEPIEEPASESAGVVIYEISQDASVASFTLGEILNGEDVTVVGTTDQVAGQIAFDGADLSTAQIGTILVNARTFVTDNEFRNRAIQNRILFTGEFEFVEFVPTALNGLPDSVAAGESVSFEIAGDLTVKGVTNPVVFDATVTWDSAETISGSATTTIQYADYDIAIPNVPSVAEVDEDLIIEIAFVANATP